MRLPKIIKLEATFLKREEGYYTHYKDMNNYNNVDTYPTQYIINYVSDRERWIYPYYIKSLFEEDLAQVLEDKI